MNEWIYEYLGLSHSLQTNILATFIVLLLIFFVRRALVKILDRQVEEVKAKYTWRKVISYTSYLVFFLTISPIWLSELRTIGTFLGLLSAGLAIALKDPIANFFGWIYILVKKPFEMGDRIQVGTIEGDVLDIGFLEFTLMEIKNWVKADQSTGRIVHVPNGLLFNQAIMNYDQGMDLIWHEIPIVITFESNWKEAKEILEDIENNTLKVMITDVQQKMKDARNKYLVSYSQLDPTVYTQIKDQGILLTLRYLCPPKKRRDIEQVAIEEILEQFAAHKDIEFAYPTTRFYNALNESS